MVKEIYHSTSIDPLQRVLEPGDWLISIDDRPVPFEPSSGVSALAFYMHHFRYTFFINFLTMVVFMPKI